VSFSKIHSPFRHPKVSSVFIARSRLAIYYSGNREVLTPSPASQQPRVHGASLLTLGDCSFCMYALTRSGQSADGLAGDRADTAGIPLPRASMLHQHTALCDKMYLPEIRRSIFRTSGGFFHTVRFQVLTETSMNAAVFWVVGSCGSHHIDRRFIARC
jgi:hypothetical protein